MCLYLVGAEHAVQNLLEILVNLLHQRGRKHFLLCKGGKILTNQVGNGGYAALSEQLFQFGNIQRILRCVVGTELVSFQNQFAAAGNVLAVALLHGFALGGCGVPGNAVGHIAGYFAPQAAAAKLDQAAAALGYNIRRQAPSSQARQKCISCRRKWNTWAGAFSHRSSVARLRNA